MTDELPGGWGPALEDLARRRVDARAMGGEERLTKKHAKGQLDARQRIDHLLDPGSFRELGTLVGDVPGDGIVAGAGRIDGRPVMVGAEDFTVLAGSIGSGSTLSRPRPIRRGATTRPRATSSSIVVPAGASIGPSCATGRPESVMTSRSPAAARRTVVARLARSSRVPTFGRRPTEPMP